MTDPAQHPSSIQQYPANRVVSYAVAALSDIMSGFGVPGAAVLGEAVRTALEARSARKSQDARQILLEEIREGGVPRQPDDLEECAAIMLRYARAVHEGVGRTNLRLLAAVFAGQLTRESVFADEFYRWADTLSSLRAEEIEVLAAYLRHAPADLRSARLVDLGKRVYADIFGQDMSRWEEFEATRGALLRTGLLSLSVTGGGIGTVAQHTFAPTHRLQALGQLVELELVLERSGQKMAAE